jgi:ATP phosphoribosyltransferase
MFPLTIALSRGRIFDETLPLLAAAGIAPEDDPEASRKLILASNRADLRFVIVRASDVPTYVQHGAADLGVAGKDVLLEHGGEGLYQPVDLAIGRWEGMGRYCTALLRAAVTRLPRRRPTHGDGRSRACLGGASCRSGVIRGSVARAS